MADRAGQTVLTTGANSGLGLATVVHLAKIGFHSVGSVRSEAKALAVNEAASRAGVGVHTVLLDVTDPEGCATVVEQTRPWAVVNNAGYSRLGAIEDVTDDAVRGQLETMLVAPMRLARLALPFMREEGEGRVVNISSIYGLASTPFSGWYQASKHALEGASDALRMEVARDGIKVVLIEPGGFKTGIWDEVEEDVAGLAGSKYEAGYERTRNLLRRLTGFMGEPETVAKAVGRALTARAPRARYRVGRDAQFVAVAQHLVPTALRDRVIRIVCDL